MSKLEHFRLSDEALRCTHQPTDNVINRWISSRNVEFRMCHIFLSSQRLRYKSYVFHRNHSWKKFHFYTLFLLMKNLALLYFNTDVTHHYYHYTVEKGQTESTDVRLPNGFPHHQWKCFANWIEWVGDLYVSYREMRRKCRTFTGKQARNYFFNIKIRRKKKSGYRFTRGLTAKWLKRTYGFRDAIFLKILRSTNSTYANIHGSATVGISAPSSSPALGTVLRTRTIERRHIVNFSFSLFVFRM